MNAWAEFAWATGAWAVGAWVEGGEVTINAPFGPHVRVRSDPRGARFGQIDSSRASASGGARYGGRNTRRGSR